MNRTTPSTNDIFPARERRRVTLAEVAKRARVSQAVASQVLSGRKGSTRFSESTANRVRRIARSLHYRPTLATRILCENRTMTLGVGLPALNDTYASAFLQPAIGSAVELGYETIVTVIDRNLDQRLSHLLDREVDGMVLFVQREFRQTDVFREIVATGRPVVIIEHDTVGEPFDFVGMDELAGYQQVISHLQRLGHSKIAFIHEPEGHSPSSHQRRVDFEQVIANAGLPVMPRWYLQAGGEVSNDALDRVFGSARDFTAVVIRGFERTQWALSQFDQLGIRVPEDLSLVNVTAHDYTRERLRIDSLRTPVEQIGQRSIELLVDKINNPDRPRRRELLSGWLVAGETCAPIGPGNQ